MLELGFILQLCPEARIQSLGSWLLSVVWGQRDTICIDKAQASLAFLVPVL